MRNFFIGLTVILILIGFAFPPAFIGALLTAFIAVGAAPPGVRADGKRKTGGLLGGAWDAAVIASKMRDCPHCMQKVHKDATRCNHCQGEITPDI